MNLPNRITLFRILLSIFLLAFLMIPWYQLGINFPFFSFVGKISVDGKYILAGILFILACLSDFLDGYLARNRNEVTDLGKTMDAIADKILVNGILVILAYQGFINLIVPIIIITRDTIVDSIKMVNSNNGKVVGASFLGKAKTVCMMSGISLLFFYNLPFELIKLPIADIFIFLACILSIISGCEYYYKSKDLLFKEK